MANVGDTGQGWTFTFGTQSITLLITNITIGKWSVSVLDVSNLASSGFMKKIAGDLKEAAPMKIDFIYKTITTAPVVGTTPETMTVTAALMTGDTAAATLAGTGFVSELEWPSPQLNQVNKGSCTIVFDGDTGPTYTKAT